MQPPKTCLNNPCSLAASSTLHQDSTRKPHLELLCAQQQFQDAIISNAQAVAAIEVLQCGYMGGQHSQTCVVNLQTTSVRFNWG